MKNKESQSIERGVFVDQSMLESGFRDIGVENGMTLIVHSSLSSLGWVCGKSAAVILALQTVLGKAGTIVVPTHSSDLSDPQAWNNPPVPQDWVQKIRDKMPAFDPDLTPTRGMGNIPDTLRGMKESVRSMHPHVSFTALGPAAEAITGLHPLDSALGQKSPLGKLYERSASILLIGVGYENCTSLHLSEYFAEYKGKKNHLYGAPVLVNGNREWVTFEDLLYNEDNFEDIGIAFELNSKSVKSISIGSATCKLIPVRELVDFGAKWMSKNR